MLEFLTYLVHPISYFGIMAVLAMSLQLILGGAGLLSLGHAAYFAVGGYSSAVFVIHIAPLFMITNPLMLLISGMIFGSLMASIAGYLVAIPCLRLSGDYLAMATLGFGEIVSTIFKNIDFLGGTRGFKDIPRLASPIEIWITAFFVGLFLYRFYRSHFGYAILATRDDEIAARSLGISTSQSKTLAFVLGSAIAGIAGSLYVHSIQFISPDAAGFGESVNVLLAVVIGGMFSFWGSIAGAFIVALLPEILRFAPELVRENRMLFFSVLVIVIMLTNPGGLAKLIRRSA